MNRATAVLLAAGALLLGACGDDDSGSQPGPSAASGDAKTAFTTLCGGCHTLAAAGTGGGVGPNLDDLKPSRDDVLDAIAQGPGAMPDNLVAGAAAEEIADYVATSAGS